MRVAEPAPTDFDAWVRWLADPVRSSRAFWHLVGSGAPAHDAVVRGLASTNASIRRGCTKALDHLVEESSYPALIALMDDDDASVRMEALHALACDRCKDDSCRPAAHAVLPRSIAVLRSDPDAHVRAYAVELVGRFVHTHREAEAAITIAASDDASPAVRKKASWYAPGGTVHAKTRPMTVAARHPPSSAGHHRSHAVDRANVVSHTDVIG